MKSLNSPNIVFDTGDSIMGEHRTLPMMLFVLGLFLLAIGTYLIIYNPNPLQSPIPPHRELGSYLVIAGVAATLNGLLGARGGKSKTTVENTQEQPLPPLN
jgi:hypothetical protein